MTSKIKNNFFAAFVAMVLIATMFSCAQVGTVTGGEKDTLEPHIAKSKPVIDATEFDGRVLKIKFNEFFALDKVESKFMMSPPHDSVKPKIKVKGKWLVIKMKEDLKKDTSYCLQFFDAVKDFNEGNKIDNFQFAFSTGRDLDSCAVSGHVYDASTLEVQKEMVVMLYGEQTNFEDSVPMKRKPDYVTKTDTAGYFMIDYIIPGRYKVFALSDINDNMLFDLENEKIAFLKSILVTNAEHVKKVDSLPAGTVLHLGEKGHRILDTLLTDTVIVQDLVYRTPNNLKLYSFEEVHLVQYISEKVRDRHERFKICFNKTVGQDSVVFTYVDDTLTSPSMIYDFNHSRDTLMVWLRDTADVNNDTLQLRCSFATLDSLNNPTIETDTLDLRFKVKKVASKDGKTPAKVSSDIDSLNFVVKSNFSGEFDKFRSIRVTVPIVYDKLDTSKLKLYEVVDSSFVEDLNNKLVKSVRLDSANYRLVFKKPIKGDICFYPTDSIVTPDWYRALYSQNRDTVDIEVLDSAMIRKSKFSNMLKYYNDYYLGQVQKIRDSVSTVIINQKIISYSRPARDTIKVLLEKSPTQGVDVSPINLEKFPENGIEVVQDRDRITLLLRDSAAIKKDTLVLKFNTFDRQIFNRNHKLIDKTLKDTLFAIYKIPFQKITKKDLVGTDSLRFVFERKLSEVPQVSLPGFDYKGDSWFTQYLSASRDTFMVISQDADFLAMDTIKLALSYKSFDKKENEIVVSDTLMFPRPNLADDKQDEGKGRRRKSDAGLKAKKENEETKKNMAKATLMFPLEYTMDVDSMDSKCRILNYEFEPGKQYALEVDDSTFVSIYDTPNLYVFSKAKIRGLESYGTLSLNLSNIGNIENYPDIDPDLPPFEDIDTSRTLHKRFNPNDTVTVKHQSLNEGQLIVCLCNAKGQIKYQKFVKADEKIVFDFVLPAEYIVRIIHDVNNNGKWDTGKYIDGLYPERVIQFDKPQTIKSNWTTELEWKL